MNVVEVIEGGGPVLLSQPHVSTRLPEDVARLLTPRALELADTDWWIDRLYDGLVPEATVVRAGVSRYALDVNRDPSGRSLYPGRNTTELCPTTDFDGCSLYRAGAEPDAAEVENRRRAIHERYHEVLDLQLQRLRRRHPHVLLFDCHSIRSRIPHLFDGELPAFNLGTDGGATCAGEVEAAAVKFCARRGLDFVLNGRFRGGWTVRHHGAPARGIHAFQLELAQRTYLDEGPPWSYVEHRAELLRAHLAALLGDLESAVRRLAPRPAHTEGDLS